MPNTAVDFVIVGGGIGGLVLAELLGRGDKKVMVLERSTGPASWTRPEILWPATVEVLFSLIRRAQWEKTAILPLRGLQVFNRGQVTDRLPESIITESGVQPWSTDPNEIRELLFSLNSFDVRRGVEVLEVLMEKDRVSGVRARNVKTGECFDVAAEWTVGDDGAHSKVREGCGIELNARLFPLEFLCFKFKWPDSLPTNVGRSWPNPAASRTGIVTLGAVPTPRGNGAGIVIVHGRDFDANPNVAKSWRNFCAIDPTIQDVIGERKFPDEFFRIRRPWGHAPRYGARGAIIMGDAAHPVSPVGGQGANMSVGDARVIAELALSNSSALVAEYERRRRPANNRSLTPTRIAAFILGLPRWCRPVSLLFGVVARLGRYPRFFRNRLKFASTAFLEDAERRQKLAAR